MNKIYLKFFEKNYLLKQHLKDDNENLGKMLIFSSQQNQRQLGKLNKLVKVSLYKLYLLFYLKFNSSLQLQLFILKFLLFQNKIFIYIFNIVLCAFVLFEISKAVFQFILHKLFTT